jgi:hypothetical protein
VVNTPGGYLMVYGGSDGEISRLHMATSEDSHRWNTQGTIMQRGPEDESRASVCLAREAGQRNPKRRPPFVVDDDEWMCGVSLCP